MHNEFEFVSEWGVMIDMFFFRLNSTKTQIQIFLECSSFGHWMALRCSSDYLPIKYKVIFFAEKIINENLFHNEK